MRATFAPSCSAPADSSVTLEDWDLGLCTTSEPAFGEPQRNGKIRSFLRRDTFLSGSRRCASVLQTQVPKLCTALDLGLLYILILGSYSKFGDLYWSSHWFSNKQHYLSSKFARKNDFPALGVCFPQPCSSTGRSSAASRSCSQKYRRIVSFPQQKFRWNAL